MLGSVQAFDTFNGQQVGRKAGNLGPHFIEELTELLNIRFAGRIIYCSRPLSQYGRHNNIGCARNAGLIKKHMSAPQGFGLNGKHAGLFVENEISS